MPSASMRSKQRRAICGEMHSGFTSLRSALPMNLRGHFPGYKVWSRAQADIDQPANNVVIDGRKGRCRVVQQDREFISGDVIAAAGQQNRARDLVGAQQLLQPPRKFLELAARVRHVVDRIAFVSNGFHVVKKVVLEYLQDVVKGIVKPGIAFGDQHARSHRTSEQGSRPGGNLWRGRRSTWFGRKRHPSDRRCPLARLFGPERDDVLRHRLAALDCGAHAGLNAR